LQSDHNLLLDHQSIANISLAIAEGVCKQASIRSTGQALAKGRFTKSTPADFHRNAANTDAHLNTCGAVLTSFWSKLRRRYCYMHAKKNHLKVVFFFI
jgi:hypothetical protein